MDSNFLNNIYEKKFGNTDDVKSLGWGSLYSQSKRLEVLLEIGIKVEDSVLDVGCGYGDASVFIENYTGIDLRESAITIANRKYPDKKFFQKSLFEMNHKFDWIIASGIFCFHENWKQNTDDIIRQMWCMCEKGLSINFLSNLTTGLKDSDMKYVSTGELIEILEQLSNKFAIRHDYLPNDVTIYLYK